MAELRPFEARIVELFAGGLTREQVLAETKISPATLSASMSLIRSTIGKDLPGHGARRLRRLPGIFVHDVDGAKKVHTRRAAARDAHLVRMFEQGKTRAEVAESLRIQAPSLHLRIRGVRKRMGRDLPGYGAEEHDPMRQRGNPLRQDEKEQMVPRLAQLFEEGLTREEVGDALKLTTVVLDKLMRDARKKLGRDLPGHGARQTGSHGFLKGHGPTNNQWATPPAKLEKRHEKLDALDTAERCPVCCLLLPHYDCVRPRGRARSTA